MFHPRPDKWLFGAFWDDSGGPGGGASTGQGGAPSGGSTGDAGADAATAAGNAAGVGNVGPGANANAAAVGGVTAAQGFQGFTGFGGPSSPGADSVSNAGAPPGSGVVGGGNVSIGGPGNVGGGVVGGTGGGGFGGAGGFGGGIGGGAGAPTGGNAGGVAGGGFGTPQGTNPAIANPLREAAQLGLGNEGVLHGLGNAAPAGTVTSSPLAYTTGLTPGQIANINASLTSLAQQSTTLGTPTPSLTDLAKQIGLAPTLGGSEMGPTSLSPNMGYPAVEGVSPGLTAMPGPSPSPGQNVNAFGSPVSITGNMPGPAAFGGSVAAAVANAPSPVAAAVAVANQIANQSPAEQSQTVADAITTAQQTMTPQNFESFLTQMLALWGQGTGEGEGSPSAIDNVTQDPSQQIFGQPPPGVVTPNTLAVPNISQQQSL